MRSLISRRHPMADIPDEQRDGHILIASRSDFRLRMRNELYPQLEGVEPRALRQSGVDDETAASIFLCAVEEIEEVIGFDLATREELTEIALRHKIITSESNSRLDYIQSIPHGISETMRFLGK